MSIKTTQNASKYAGLGNENVSSYAFGLSKDLNSHCHIAIPLWDKQMPHIPQPYHNFLFLRLL